MQGRKEVKGLTIDGEHSKDLDDAIWMERVYDGYIVTVSVVDPMVIEVGSEDDLAALEQGFTRYYADCNKPMLPRKLSEGSMSLLEGYLRPTISVFIHLSDDLSILSSSIERTYLRSFKKLSYEGAEALMGTLEDPFLGEACALGVLLLEKRKNEGALVFYDRLNRIVSGEEGTLSLLEGSKSYNSHILIQEFMILANKVVAEYFVKHSIPALFRNHSAKNIAPERSELISDLSNISTDMNRVGIFSERLNMVLERAKYGSSLSGHYGLNLPCYLHFTSPIRRYADLVNHRQLSSHLLGVDYPYSIGKLLVIGDKLNLIESVIKDKRGNSFKDKAASIAKSNLSDSGLSVLNRKEFSRVIKVACRESLLTDDLSKVIIERLKGDLLISNDLYVILFESLPYEWKPIKDSVFSYMESNTQYCTEVLVMAHQSKEGYTLPRYTMSKSGSDDSAVFSGIGSITVDGMTYFSLEQKSYSRKSFEQLCCLSILEILMSRESKIRDLSVSARGAVSVSAEHKVKLQEKCQLRKWSIPKYNLVSKSGSAHVPSFTLTCEVVIGGVTHYSSPFVGSSKKSSECLCAKDLYEKLSGK